MEEVKKHWFLICFVFGAIGGSAIWIATIDSKTFNSPEQKVRHEIHVSQSLTPFQQQLKFTADTTNANSATRARAIRLERERVNDSMKHVNDSLILDMITRQAVQTQLQTERLEMLEKKLIN